MTAFLASGVVSIEFFFFWLNSSFQFHPNNYTFFSMRLDGRFGTKVVKGAPWWRAGHFLPLSVPKLAPTVNCWFGTWPDFCLWHAQHSFTPDKSAREGGVWLGLTSFLSRNAQTRKEPYFHLTFNHNIWKKQVWWIYSPSCEVSLWRVSLNIGQMRVSENCHDASLSLCSMTVPCIVTVCPVRNVMMHCWLAILDAFCLLS